MGNMPTILYSAEFESEEAAARWREYKIADIRDAHIHAAKWHSYRKMTNQVGIPEYLTEVIEQALWEFTRGVYSYAPSQAEREEIRISLHDARI